MEQFSKPPVEIVAYTAGLFDGEGSVYYLEGQNRFGATLSQSIPNNGEELCRWLCAAWGIGTVNKQRKSFRNAEPFYMWSWSINARRELHFFLESIMPYLRVKRDRAVEAMSYISARAESRTCWSKNEDRFLRDNYQTPDFEIGVALGRTEAAVRHRRSKLDMESVGEAAPGVNRSWSKSDLDYLRSHLHQTDREIGSALGKTPGAIRSKRERMGITRA